MIKTKTDLETIDNVRARMSSSIDLRDLVGKEAEYARKNGDMSLSAIYSDSRRVTPGSAFFALPGMRTNGNEHLQEAVRRGAKVVVTDSDEIEIPGGAVRVKVNDARIALAKFSKRYHGSPDENLDVVGITGTNGKTTVATLTRHLLEAPGRPVGLVGTVKYHLGDRVLPSFRTTPEAADLYALLRNMLVGGCSEAVMEVSSHGIHQSRVAGLNLEVAAFLNLTRDHLDYHGNMESYFREKRKLFNGMNGALPKLVVINGDCPYGKRLLEELPPQVRALTFGFDRGNDFRATELSLDVHGSKFLLECPTGSMVITSPLIGKYNVMNVLASFAIIHSLGRSVSACVRKLAAFGGVEGRMEIIDRGQDYRVVVDYAHTPDALRNALGMLKECTNGKVHLVFGCGGERDRGKRMEMTRVACAGADSTIATSDNPRGERLKNIFEDMKKGVSKGAEIQFVEDRRRAISRVLDQASVGDCVLIAGKGHETFQEVNSMSIPFDDRLVTAELLEAKQLAR